MKKLWVKVDPWDKKLVTTALESGADALWVPQGRTEAVKALGLITVVAPDGDLAPGQDVQEVAITSTADEAEVIRLARQGWAVRPLRQHRRDACATDLKDFSAASGLTRPAKTTGLRPPRNFHSRSC